MPASVTFGGVEVQLLELAEPGQFFQPRVGDLGEPEVQRPELLEPGQFFQPRVGHLGEAEVHADNATAKLLDGLGRFVLRLIGVEPMAGQHRQHRQRQRGSGRCHLPGLHGR
jgi:hypothetical protein